MTFLTVLIIYLIVGIIPARIIYNLCVDDAYEEYLEQLQRNKSWQKNNEDRALEMAKSPSNTAFSTIMSYIFWPLLVSGWVVYHIIKAIAQGLDRILPKSEAVKAKKARDLKKLQAEQMKAYKQALKVIEGNMEENDKHRRSQ